MQILDGMAPLAEESEQTVWNVWYHSDDSERCCQRAGMGLRQDLGMAASKILNGMSVWPSESPGISKATSMYLPLHCDQDFDADIKNLSILVRASFDSTPTKGALTLDDVTDVNEKH